MQINNTFVAPQFDVTSKPGLNFFAQKKTAEQNQKTGMNYDLNKEAAALNISSLGGTGLGAFLNISA